jgi:hypothetical protein
VSDAAHPSHRRARKLVSFIGYCRECDMLWEVEPGVQECPACAEWFPNAPEPDWSGRPVLRVIRGTAIRRTPPTGKLCIIVSP